MNTQLDIRHLTAEERATIDGSPWFASLSATARHDLLRHARVRRYGDGMQINARGSQRTAWFACASGLIRVSSTSASGKQTTLTHVRPGVWFGGPGLFDGGRATHDTHAIGATTVLHIPPPEFDGLLAAHADMARAVLQQQARHIRQLYDALEEAGSWSLRQRLAKQLLSLARIHGRPAEDGAPATRIGLDLPQGQLAQLIGYSRQRVNEELKRMERSGLIRIDRAGLVVCDPEGLKAFTA